MCVCVCVCSQYYQESLKGCSVPPLPFHVYVWKETKERKKEKERVGGLQS